MSCCGPDSFHDFNFVSVQDVRSYLQKICYTYSIIRTLTPTQLYEYFLQSEHDYIFNGADNFCSLTHSLNPTAYAAYHQKLRNMTHSNVRPGAKYSIAQIMKCSGCKTPFTSAAAMNVHLLGGTAICTRCEKQMNYENVAVQAFQETYTSNPEYMVHKHWRTSLKGSCQFPNPPTAFTWKETWAYVRSTQFTDLSRPHWYKAFNRVMNEFSWAGCDLILAMYRQIDFIIKICQTEELYRYWNRPEVIEVSLVRYHKFVKLCFGRPNTIIVPTVDIDLVWHSHLAQHAKYSTFFKINFKRILTHDDTINESTGNLGFDQTYKLWSEKYREQYSLHRPANSSARENKRYDKLPVSSLLTETTFHINKMGTPVHISSPERAALSAPGQVFDPGNPLPTFPENYFQVLPFVYNGTFRRIPYQESNPNARRGRRGGASRGGCAAGGGCGGGDGGGCGGGDGGGGCGGGGCGGGGCGGGGCGGGCGGG